MKILIENLKQLVTPYDNNVKKGIRMGSLRILKNVSILIDSGYIVDVGKFSVSNVDLKIDGSSLVALPGFIDSHTHIPFYGKRWKEFYMRNAGKDYMDILNAGGGILETVSKLRSTDFNTLLDYNQIFVNEMLSFGVTTIEGKSGYGLDIDNEIKQLKVLNQLKKATIIPTFLGPHSVPPDRSKEEYLDLIINDMAPKIKKRNLANFADIFCEKGVFELKETERYLDAMKKLGFKLRMHSDEIESIGGTKLAVDFGAKSVDHLIAITNQDILLLAKSDTIANLLPGTSFFLNKSFAPARTLIDSGAAVALSSDFNPGSCYISNPNMIIHLAMTKMKMRPEEIVNAYTINPANILDLKETGLLEENYLADIQLHCLDDFREIAYSLGHNTLAYVLKKGEVIYENRRIR